MFHVKRLQVHRRDQPMRHDHDTPPAPPVALYGQQALTQQLQFGVGPGVGLQAALVIAGVAGEYEDLACHSPERMQTVENVVQGLAVGRRLVERERRHPHRLLAPEAQPFLLAAEPDAQPVFIRGVAHG